MFTSTLASFRSEWILLNRGRLWTLLLTTAAVLAVGATWLVLDTADTAGPERTPLAAISGATSAVMSAMSFVGLLVAASFAALATTEIDRGLFRSALTRQPRRVALVVGRLAARLSVAAVAGLVVLVAGAVTAVAVAPSVDVSTNGWFGADGLGQIAQDAGRFALFTAVYAAIGTTAAVVVRSTPIALGALLLWFGPIENVVGAGHGWAERWFPGLVMRSLMNPDAPAALSTGTVLWTSAVFLAVCATITLVAVSRRDVTS
ncbi:ABC transporter permease [Jongsikchunia kroppenstedtii]|uniref:ABC transporter permease n=1 Tax=Jongsikchunia kroppenstedtii TaxID=1121721 RepID=UPI000362FE29|nr:ABC transporter permease [Jongsikchunia kroppenstedtii]